MTPIKVSVPQASGQGPVVLPKLLALPAEIRNTIYKYALQESEPVVITKALRPPGLLSVSRQVRHETFALWLSMPELVLVVDDFDCTLVNAWAAMMNVHSVDKGPVLVFPRSYNWANILKRCEHIHQGGVTLQIDVMGLNTAILRNAQQVTLASRERSWAECKELLEDFRVVLENFDAKWAQ